MTKIKPSSTNQLNKSQIMIKCPVTFTLNKIGGRWKPLIIYNLLDGKKRYSELKKAIPNITEKMLIQHLRQLEEDQLVERKAMPVVPPHVEYKLTKQGRELGPVLQAMVDWALRNNKYVVPKTAKAA
jgi:DNA-binding HxlR family transcriptional regulator